LNVALNGKDYAVECKRMELGEYGERERQSARELWRPTAQLLIAQKRSTFCDVHFRVPLSEVPKDYLPSLARRWLDSKGQSLKWSNDIASGFIGDLDLGPLQTLLETDYVLMGSSRLFELLSGEYVRHANYNQVLSVKPGENPRYIDECDLAVLLRWESLSAEATDAKARDVLRKLAEANDQLPEGVPGIVHIGFETVETDRVERLRHKKIIDSVKQFDAKGKKLECVYCHYFVPESPPDASWAFDETTQWSAVSSKPPIRDLFLIVPPGEEQRSGPHWEV